MNHPGTRSTTPSRWGSIGTLLIAVLVIVLGGTAALAFFFSSPAADNAATAATSELAAAEKSSFDITTLAMGELEAKNRIEIRNRMDKPSTIVEIVPEGTTVAAGDILVRLNSDSIEDDIDAEELALDEANAELQAAQTALEIQKSENESKLRKADLDIQLARLALQQWQEGEVKQMRKDQQLAIEQAQREVERLSDKCARDEELLKQKFISMDEVRQDNMALIDAQAKLEKAKLAQKVYEEYQYPRDEKQKQSDLAEAQAEFERVKQENEINITSKQAAVSNRQRQVERREQRLADLNQQLSYATVVAPSPGLVVYGSTAQSDDWRWSNEGPLAVGRQVGPNDLLIVLPDTSQMVAKVKVHESLAGKVHPGQQATVRIEAVGNRTFMGTVESIGVMAESGGWRDPNRREYSVRITLDQGQKLVDLKPSMRAEARIMLERVDDVVHVPVQSIFMDGPVTFVYEPSGSKYVRVPVQVGRRSDTRAEIKNGINQGELVLVRAPSAGEIIAEPWKPDDLKQVGYALDDQGKPIPMNAEAAASPGPTRVRQGQHGKPVKQADAQHAPEKPVDQPAGEDSTLTDTSSDAAGASTLDAATPAINVQPANAPSSKSSS